MGLLDGILSGVVKTVIGVIANGDTATLTRRTRGYNPLTGVNTDGTVTATPAYTPPAPVSFKDINGTTVLAGDMKITIPAQDLGMIPGPECVLALGAVEWKIVEVSPIYSGSSVVTWVLFLRK